MRLLLAARYSFVLLFLPLFAVLVAPRQLLAETPRERAEQILDKTTTFEFVDTPLKDICAHLSDHYKIKIRVSQQEERLYPDIPVSANFRNISLRSALNLMLDARACDYRVTDEGEIVVIDAAANSKSRRPVSKIQEAAARKNAQLLEKVESSLEFIDTPFHDVVAFVAEQAEVTIAIDRDALDAVNLQHDSPITINVPKTKLYRALTALLFPYDLHVELRNEVLYITSRDDRIPRRAIADEFKRLALQPVKIDLRHPPLHEAIESLANQANCTIVFDHRRVAAAKIAYDTPVVGPLPEMPLRDALTKILQPHGLRTMVYDDVIFVTPVAVAKPK